MQQVLRRTLPRERHVDWRFSGYTEVRYLDLKSKIILHSLIWYFYVLYAASVWEEEKKHFYPLCQ